MAASAAALRLFRRSPEAPPNPMLRHLFPASYSKAATAGASLPEVCRAPLLPSLIRHYCRKVTPKGEQHCCNSVPNINSDGITVSNAKSDSNKSLLDDLKYMRNNGKSLQDREKNIERLIEMLNKVMHDCRNTSDLILKRVNDTKKLVAMLRKTRDASGRIDAASSISKLMDDNEECLDMVESAQSLVAEQVRALEKEVDDYCNAVRRHQEFGRFVKKKIAKVCAAVGLGAGFLLILAKVLG